jgi:hypothetical protein
MRIFNFLPKLYSKQLVRSIALNRELVEQTPGIHEEQPGFFCSGLSLIFTDDSGVLPLLLLSVFIRG